MKYRAVIFDLDGTLLDTLEDLALAANAALEQSGYPTHPISAYRYFVGNGGDTLIGRALPEGEVARLGETGLRHLTETMRREYAARAETSTRPYAGIPELLATLQEQRLISGVLSNKPHLATLRVIQHFFPDHPFRAVQGAVSDVPLKPDPTSALAMAAGFGIVPEDILYLGDTDVDMRTACAAGMFAVGAAWGFRTESELRANGAARVCLTPYEVQALL